MIEENIFSLLSSSIPTAKVYPVTLPTDPTLPAISFMFVGGQVGSALDSRGWQRSRLQVDCWAAGYLDAITLRSQVVQALANYRDTTMSITVLQTLDFFEADSLEYRALAEFQVFYNL